MVASLWQNTHFVAKLYFHEHGFRSGGLFMCSACCGNLLILLLDGLACCLACCFVLLAFRRPLVFICSLHSLPGVRWFHSCLWWLGCLERGFVRASGGWLRVVVGSVCFFPLFGLGWLWFPRLLLGCGLLAAVCCGGRFLLPSAHALSTWGQFMDKVIIRETDYRHESNQSSFSHCPRSA